VFLAAVQFGEREGHMVHLGCSPRQRLSDLLSNSAFDPNRIIPEAVVLCAGEVFDRDMGSRVAMGTGTVEVAAYDR
jgi:hypothetical protein